MREFPCDKACCKNDDNRTQRHLWDAHDLNVARLGSFIVALGNHVIPEMSLKTRGTRKPVNIFSIDSTSFTE